MTATSATAVIVTGAARGLRRAMTLALAGAGASVLAVDLASAQPAMDELLAQAAGLGLEAGIAAGFGDVTDPADCTRLVQACVAGFGAVHGLVNNAAIGMQDIGAVLGRDKTPFYKVADATWRRSIDVNINGPFQMAKTVAPLLIAAGWGRIVNVTTNYITMAADGGTPYGPSKAALEIASAAWAKDLAGTGVSVNVLVPGGAANTRMIPDSEAPDRSSLVQPEAMGPPIIWLMSRGSDGITGQRFSAREWNIGLDPLDAARRSGHRAGW